MFFVAVFSLDCAQTTIGLEFCMNNYPIEMLTFKSLSHSKTKDVHGCSAFNINCSA